MEHGCCSDENSIPSLLKHSAISWTEGAGVDISRSSLLRAHQQRCCVHPWYTVNSKHDCRIRDTVVNGYCTGFVTREWLIRVEKTQEQHVLFLSLISRSLSAVWCHVDYHWSNDTERLSIRREREYIITACSILQEHGSEDISKAISWSGTC